MFRSAWLLKTSQNRIASPPYYLKKFCIERPNKDISDSWEGKVLNDFSPY